MKVAAKTIGFELVNTTPLAGPSGVLPYMDYVYSGSKQPYGATPAYDAETANPHVFRKGRVPADENATVLQWTEVDYEPYNKASESQEDTAIAA